MSSSSSKGAAAEVKPIYREIELASLRLFRGGLRASVISRAAGVLLAEGLTDDRVV